MKPHEKFEEYIFDACIKYGIKSIGEEMCKDALDEFSVTQSTVKIAAEKNGIPHTYCGPGRKEREARGILGESLLEALRIHNEWTDEEFNNEVLKDRKKRELIWVERIKPVYEDPMLFVCGIGHLDTFSQLLKTNGYICVILEKQWDSRPMN